MKHAIYGTVLVFAAVLVLAAVLLVSGGDVRENEIDKALNTAVEQALEELKVQGGYEAGGYERLIADFQQALLLHVASDSDIKVEILAADAEKGVLDVQVTEVYAALKGRQKEASVRKTVLLEEYTDQKPYHTITFQSEGEAYAAYSLYEGSLIVKPKDPEREGRQFQGWREVLSGAFLEPDWTAKEDTIFEAVFE